MRIQRSRSDAPPLALADALRVLDAAAQARATREAPVGRNAKIPWTDSTFNPWWGCAAVSPGCAHCYAETLGHRFGVEWGPLAPRRFFGPKHWSEPEAWNRAAEREGRPAFVFCASMCDVFDAHGDARLAEARERLWGLIGRTPNLVWLLLTKRPQHVSQFVPAAWRRGCWPVNAWLGVTAEDQRRAGERIPILLSLPAPRRFVSYEPALGPVDFSALEGARLDWVVVGGESGSDARPFDVAWARDTVRQCRQAGVAAWVKQLGRRPYIICDVLDHGCVDERATAYPITDRDGRDLSEWPADIRVQERPEPLPMRGAP